jgi:hypothetical protein
MNVIEQIGAIQIRPIVAYSVVANLSMLPNAEARIGSD